MKSAALEKIAKTVGDGIAKYSPEILTGLGIAGMMSATFLAIKATPKYEVTVKNDKDISKKERAKLIFKFYGPTFALTAASASCIIFANGIHNKRNTLLATACSMSEEAFKEYRDKALEVVGEKKENDIRDAVAKEQIEKNPVENNEVYIVDSHSSTLCYESISGRYFQSDIESLRRAENRINKQMFGEMYASLNDFYYEIGLESTDMGNSLGWNINRANLDLSFSSQLTKDDRPCLVINYIDPPIYDYDII